MGKDEEEPLAEFIKRKGGINECTLGTADASGDLRQEGDQSRLFGAAWRARRAAVSKIW
jgi:hypothetical protein